MECPTDYSGDLLSNQIRNTVCLEVILLDYLRAIDINKWENKTRLPNELPICFLFRKLKKKIYCLSSNNVFVYSVH